MPPTISARFLSNELCWPVSRRDRRFDVYVVEPDTYSPKNHRRVFEAAIDAFVRLQPVPVDSYSSGDTPAAVPFDLLTFPEAFLPADALAEALQTLGQLSSLGCVHVGLRSSDNANHLFVKSELRCLLEKLCALSDVVTEDVAAFSRWLEAQTDTAPFNVGCLFMIDAKEKLRVCLHPKLVSSKFELSPLQEQNLEEANLLTVITLQPTDASYKRITIQPLICSDVLRLDTNKPDNRPLEALQAHGSCLVNPPDHIDIVSVVTCTPQVSTPSGKSSYRSWHQEFQRTFESAANDDAFARHHFATFVLSNFQMLSNSEPGGLSGAFVPLPWGRKKFPGFVALSCLGRPAGERRNRWSTPEDDLTSPPEWETRGYTASLNPNAEGVDTVARIFGFTVHRLPRDRSLWSTTDAIVRCSLRAGVDSGSPATLTFDVRTNHA